MYRTSIKILIVFSLLIFSCSGKKINSDTARIKKDTIREFKDFSLAQKNALFGGVRKKFSGDFLRFSGATGNDGFSAVVLSLDSDHRFAISVQDPASEVSKILINMCLGKWVEDGDVIKLYFHLGASDVFDPKANEKEIAIIDQKTVFLAKEASELRIAGMPCRRD